MDKLSTLRNIVVIYQMTGNLKVPGMKAAGGGTIGDILTCPMISYTNHSRHYCHCALNIIKDIFDMH